MKRLLISLWLAGAVVYALCTVFFTNAVLFGNREDPKPAVKLKTPSQVLSVGGRPEPTAEASAQSGLQPITPAAAEGPHAIVPDEMSSETPYLTAPVEEPPPPGPSLPTAVNDDEILSVTSAANIRSGPSRSDEVIGTAHAGAQIAVISRDSGWIHFEDPVSGRDGWIYSGLLAPVVTADSEAASNPPAGPDVAFPPKQRNKTHAKTKSVQLPSDEEFTPTRRFREGILAKRRMRDVQLAPWDEDLPRRLRRR
jgi:hypothetical protein